MLRIICREDSFTPVDTGSTGVSTLKSFTASVPDVEAWIAEAAGNIYSQRSIIGVEVVPDEKGDA